MNVLDLFSGLEGWSTPFRERGHNIFRVEINPDFPAEHRDINNFYPSQLPWDWWNTDIILASPPCTAFSVMQIGRNWNHDDTPKTERAQEGLDLLHLTLTIIRVLRPYYFVIENPVGKMRKLIPSAMERRTVTYCQYGEKRMKPTDLFGGFPPSLALKPMCHKGSPCHTPAPRGYYSGTQGMSSAQSAKIPRELALAVCLAAEKDLGFPS